MPTFNTVILSFAAVYIVYYMVKISRRCCAHKARNETENFQRLDLLMPKFNPMGFLALLYCKYVSLNACMGSDKIGKNCLMPKFITFL